jgi:ABC-type antimicrobial peptide transport system permease subunit
MVFKNLLRRRARTALTILSIGVGVSAIIALGALADGLNAGYDNMFASSGDLVLTQADTYDVTMGAVDEAIGDDLAAMPEVRAVSPVLIGLVQTEGIPYFYVYGYPEDSFVLERFNVIRGAPLDSPEAQHTHGTPLLLGSAVSEALNRDVGDSIWLGESAFRIVGVYETGDALEDGGAVISLRDAQEMLGKTHLASLFYIQLESPDLQDRFVARVERRWPDLLITTTEDFADSQQMGDMLRQMSLGIAGMAILIGGVGMMNAQLMAVFERTREIGVLRSVGWSRLRVLAMILGESLIVCLAGGVLGIAIGYLMLAALAGPLAAYGTSAASVSPTLLMQTIGTVLSLGLIGGLIPAWRASRLQPVEALRYEGGGADGDRRLPIPGMAPQSLWRRKVRTSLTLGAIGLTVGAIVMVEVFDQGAIVVMTGVFGGTGTEVVIREAGISDTGYSSMDERLGDRVAALPEVARVSAVQMAVMQTPDMPFFVALGYAPNEYAIRRYNMVEGERLTGSRQIMLGRVFAEAGGYHVGDTIEFGEMRYRVVGIYEAGGFEDRGGVISLRDAQAIAGQPHKVQIYMVGLHDPSQAENVVAYINAHFPEAYATLSGDFVSQMPDMQSMDAMIGAIAFLSMLVGGIVVMNTMLMAVLERTREIGVLRALGWRRSRVLMMILQEALLLGTLGSVVGIIFSFVLVQLINLSPFWSILATIIRWTPGAFVNAFVIAVALGVLGGLYPAFRATRLQPVEALRYE